MAPHTPPNARAREVCQFSIHPPMAHHWSVMWLVLIWPHCLVACAIVDQPHHVPIDELREVSTREWMIAAHGTSHITKGKSKTCASFHPSTMTHPWSVMWPVLTWPPWLITCTMLYLPQPCTHWWIERGVDICMDNSTSWYITHYPRPS